MRCANYPSGRVKAPEPIRYRCSAIRCPVYATDHPSSSVDSRKFESRYEREIIGLHVQMFRFDTATQFEPSLGN